MSKIIGTIARKIGKPNLLDRCRFTGMQTPTFFLNLQY